MPKTEINRRSSNDLQWTELRERLKKRDKICRVMKCLTISEAKQCEKIQGFIKRLDCAHMFAASQFPEIIYNEKNVYRISHTFHSRLDSYQCPITQNDLDINSTFWWWWRIINSSTEKYNSDIDYKSLCFQYLKI